MPKKKVEGDNSNEHEKPVSKPKYDELQEKLIENLVELQKVHTNLAEKFDKLSEQITSLLNLFETAAKSFATNSTSPISEKDKDFLDKIDKLLDQNKTIAKGLTLIEENVRERMYGFSNSSPQLHQEPFKEEDTQRPSIINRSLPKF